MTDEMNGGFFKAVFTALLAAALGPAFVHLLWEIGTWSWGLVG